MEVRQRARGALHPGRQEGVVHVLGLDGAEPDPLHGGLGQDPSHEAGQRQGCTNVRSAGSSLGPAAVVGADVDPGQHDLPVSGGEGPAHVRQHDVRRQRPLLASGPRDDAVRAVEGAAVLDLDEGPGALDRDPAVGDAVDAGGPATRPRRPTAWAARHRAARAADRPRPGGPPPIRSSASSSARNAALSSLPTSRAPASTTANIPGSTATEQPVTTTCAAGFARRARRTAERDFSSAVDVTVQVLTRYRSAASCGSTSGTPASRRSRAAASISDWLTLQPRLTMAADRGRAPPVASGAHSNRLLEAHHRTGFVDIRNAMSPTAVVIA